uniref:Transposase n=1 Tax=Ascaris lumbricoides TaxID=6252 RepID=A0A0M3HY67_ASCLU
MPTMEETGADSFSALKRDGRALFLASLYAADADDAESVVASLRMQHRTRDHKAD